MLGSSRGGSGAGRLVRLLAASALALAAISAPVVKSAQAQTTTWAGPGVDWDTGANWSPATVPTDTAIFAGATPTVLGFLQASTSIGTIQFNAGAPSYRLNLAQAFCGGCAADTLSVTGTGIVNNSGNTQNLITAGGGIINFQNSSTAGNAAITNQSGGLTEFVGRSTAGSATFTNNAGGFLQFGSSGLYPTVIDTATAGNSTINNNAGSVSFNSATTAGNSTITNSVGFMFFNDVSSAGSSSIRNLGSITFANNATAGSANITTLAGGFLLSFADSSTAGSATITVNPFSKVQFTDSSTAGSATITVNPFSKVQFTDSASGGAARFILNSGSMDISGLSSGGMTAGSIEGSGTISLGGNALTVGGNNLSTTFAGAIQDSGTFGGTGGSLIKVGTGTLVLDGASTYTGGTAIDGGTLVLNGTLQSPVTVNSGGTFSGTGVVDPASVLINAGGIFAPGPPGGIGTMTIQGGLVFQPGAIYAVQLNPSTASSTNVQGPATLAGTVQASFQPGTYMVPKTYEILQSTGLSGTFSGLVVAPQNFQANLSYDPDNVFLSLTATLGLGGNLNVNQQNVANALNGVFNNGGALPPNFANVFGLTGQSVPNALSRLDGEVSVDAEATAFKSMDQFLALMLDPFVDGRTGSPGADAMGFGVQQASLPSDSIAPVAPDQRWTAWGAAYGGGANADGNLAIGSTNFSAQTYGVAAGLDRHIAPDLVAGFAVAGGGTQWGLAQGLGNGSSGEIQLGGYATKYFGPVYLAGDVAFANHWMSTNRTAFAGDQLTASFNAQSYAGRAEGGYRLPPSSGWTIAPYDAIQLQSFNTPRYSETDQTGGGFGLTYAGRSSYDTRNELGARADRQTTIGDWPVTLRARLAWAHDWVSNPSLQAVFETLPGSNFSVYGASIPKNTALTTLGAEMRITPSLSLLIKFDGEFAGGAQSYSGSGALRFVW